MMSKRKLVRKGLSMWVIYDHPTDAPAHVVLRRWEFVDDPPYLQPRECSMHPTIEAARAYVPLGLVRFPRDPNDDPKIVESYL
jgi:hypothetical protein